MTSKASEWLEISGALARFWAGGDGPSHSSISSAFALAGYDEPDASPPKQERVLSALKRAPIDTKRRLIEELLNLLRANGIFDEAGLLDPRVKSLTVAFSRSGFQLTQEGFVDWDINGLQAQETEEAIEVDIPPVPKEISEPDIEFLCDALTRLASAMRPLALRRRGRPAFEVTDEYDLQDMVEAILRCLYPDVRPEERTPSYAGSSSVIDFLIKDEAAAIEVKVTKVNRGEKAIKNELVVDIHDYQGHPNVKTLIAVVYDLESQFRNAAGFQSDLSRSHNGLVVRVIVVGWPLPRHQRQSEISP